MTRELKLALIVGFALVLTVAVLVSDHLSRASRAEMAQSEATTRVVAQAPQQPIRALEDLPGAQLPSVIQTDTVASNTNSTRGPISPDEMVTGDVLARGRGDALPAGMDEPTMISNGSGPRGTPAAVDPLDAHRDLVNAVEGQGGRVSPSGDGVTIDLPLGTERTYTVKPGETLYGIAEREYGNGRYWKQLAQANDLGDGSGLTAGTRLKLPTIDGATRVGAASPAEPEKLAVRPEPKVQEKSQTTKTQDGKPGKTEASKPADSKPDAATKATTYTVRKGDTLGVIAQRTLGSSKRAEEIRKLNNLKNANALVAGTTLKIPAK